jgi:hypothetical protein
MTRMLLAALATSTTVACGPPIGVRRMEPRPVQR